MIERINKYKQKLEEIKEKIKIDLEDYLRNFNYSKKNNQVEIHQISTNEDLEKIYSSPGFYIILTDQEFDNNHCSFKYGNQTAVYRGHCHSTKRRIKSHLTNDVYNATLKKYHVHYKVCMKVEEKVNGINIEDNNYKDWKWTVIVHKMRKSNKVIREQAELAFDNIYGKPCLSRE